ncbi:hypothetical protein BDZ89DRAFT_837315 [Hymenopellis radicata]|nr:hypothetical protein BDZ89DRAFT_837315 [Hymenopellis radicata]
MEIPSNKLAMSKALGAAFLRYQVEQLEKGVSPSPPRKPSRRASSQADIIVVDASLLIHGLHHVERWSKPDRQETVVIPLQVLTTLDVLKRTSKPARAASRLLEDQVGYNSRFRIQLDNDTTPPNSPSSLANWIKNTLYCARSEMNSAPRRKVVLAVCPAPTTDDRAAGTLVLDSARLADIPVLVLAASGTKPYPKRYGRASPNASVSSSSDELDADVFDFEDLIRAKRLASSNPAPTRSQSDSRTDSKESPPTRRLSMGPDSEDSHSRKRDSVIQRGDVQGKVKVEPPETKVEWPALPGTPPKAAIPATAQRFGMVKHEKDEWPTLRPPSSKREVAHRQCCGRLLR